MIHVEYLEPDELADWKTKAAKKLAEVCALASDEERKEFFKDSRNQIWKDAKQFLRIIFRDKCSYCETELDRQYGEVEHYRPKRPVPDGSNGGYYWLAYEFTNFLLACQLCNGPKATQFPVNGVRAVYTNDDLEREEPLLLNPYFDNPAQHFEYIFKRTGRNIELECTGFMKALTARGDHSIKVYNLDPDDNKLSRARARSQHNTYKRLRAAFAIFLSANVTSSLEEVIHELIPGDLPYTAACRAVVVAELEYWKTKDVDLTELIPAEWKRP